MFRLSHARRFVAFASSVRHPSLLLLLLLALAMLTGCVKVAPYQRGTLAHPSMTTEDLSTAIDGHVRGVSEGAAGGLSAGGGGCGCN